MTTVTISKTIPIPKDLRKDWEGSRVFISGDQDTLVIKRIQSTSEKNLMARLKKAGRMISQKDIQNAIDWARK